MASFSAPHVRVSGVLQDGWTSVSISSRQLTIAVFAMAFGVAASDAILPNMNLSILYSMLLVLYVRKGDRQHLLKMTLAFMALTMGVYMVKVLRNSDYSFWSYRLLNRVMLVVSIGAIATVSHFLLGVRAALNMSRPMLRQRDEEFAEYQEIGRSVEQFATGLICGILTLSIAAIDLVTPGQINLPILYAVPLFICGAMQSRKLLWGLLPFLVLFTALGYWIGPATGYAGDVAMSFAKNRSLAALALVGIAWALHLWIRQSQKA